MGDGSPSENSAHFFLGESLLQASQVTLVVKNPPASSGDIGDLGLIPGSGKSPGEGKGYLVQCSGLENSVDCIVHGGLKESDTAERLSLHFHLKPRPFEFGN